MASGPAKFVQEGSSIDYTPGADVLVGAVVVQADLIGITQAPIKAGQLGSLAVTGVFDFNKATGASSAIPAGTLTYWDAAAQNATKNADTDAAGRRAFPQNRRSRTTTRLANAAGRSPPDFH
jgi:predicted RecA/RadA family phage recombinase